MILARWEIAKMYREAKDKRKQISILQDLTLCTKEEIIKILEEEGAMAKREKTHNSDEEMAADGKEMQKKRGRRRDPMTENALNSTEEAGVDYLPSEEMLKKLTEYYKKVELKLKWMKEQVEILEKVAQGCADTIEGLVAVTGRGKEKEEQSV